MKKSTMKIKGNALKFALMLPLICLSLIFNQVNAQNYAANFDGSSGQHIQTTTMIPFTADYTVMGWINITGSTSRIFSWGSPNVNNYVNIEIYSNRLRLYVPTVSGASVSPVIMFSNSGWRHFAVTATSGSVKVYVDGVEEATGSYSKVITPTSTSFGAALLNGSYQGKGDGTYDDLSVWNVALTDVEIANYMTTAPEGTETGLAALYNFNNPAVTPGGNNTSETIVTDITGNGYDGTFVSFPLTGDRGNWVGGYVPPSAPTVTTTAITSITDITAMSGGDVTENGGESVTARGICWSTSETPTLADNFTEDGNGTGVFSSEMTGLTEQTTYYVRAYATNSVGTSYGDEVSFDTMEPNPTVPVSDWGIAIGMMLILGVTLISKKSLF